MDKLISALDAVDQEKSTSIKLRELQTLLQENMEKQSELLWISYPLNAIIENLFDRLEGIGLTSNSKLNKELKVFKHLFSELGKSLKSRNVRKQTKNLNKLIKNYINITNLL